jgi:hypothetical protein
MNGNTIDGFSDNEAREIHDDIKNLVLSIRAKRGKWDGDPEIEGRKMRDVVLNKLNSKYGITGTQLDYLYRQVSASIPRDDY